MKVRFLRPNLKPTRPIPPVTLPEEPVSPEATLPVETPAEEAPVCEVAHHHEVAPLCTSSEEVAALSDFYSLLSDGTRLKILIALDTGEMCVCDLADTCEMTKSAVSHQLALLRKGRLVTHRREGKNVFYSLADHHVKGIIEYALQHVREPHREEL